MSFRERYALAVLVSAAAIVPTLSFGQGIGSDTPTIFVGGPAALAVSRAANDARRRLQEPGCQRVLDEFTDRDGRSLRRGWVPRPRRPTWPNSSSARASFPEVRATVRPRGRRPSP